MSSKQKRIKHQASQGEGPAQASLPRRLSRAGFLLVLLFSVAWVLAHAHMVDSVTVRLCDHFDAKIHPDQRMPVFLSEIAFDGYVWNRYAEDLGKDGRWRLNFTDFDHAPLGREVHWNSGFAWYLRGLGEWHYAFNAGQPGASLRNSIYRMSIWANPILLALAILLLAPLTARRFGPLSGAVVALAMVGIPTFYEGFQPAYPDHHGLIAFSLLGMLLGLAWAGAGWVQAATGTAFIPPRSLRQARQGMIFSALCGAAGLWFSALSAALVLGTIGVAALLMSLLTRRLPTAGPDQPAVPAQATFHPGLWKTWALWGAGGSLALYLLEYLPFHLGWRLEVNHPLYAIGWLGGGWSIAILSGWWINEGAHRPFPWRKLILPVLACLPLPAMILLGGAEVYLPRDAFLWRLHQNISEFLPLLTRIEHRALSWGVAIGWFPLLLFGALALQFHRRVDAPSRLILVFMAVPVVLLTALQFYQVRWGLLVGPLYGALATILIPQLWNIIPRNTTGRAVGAICLLAFTYVIVGPSFRMVLGGVWQQYRAEPGHIPMTPGQGLALLHRQMALAIKEDAGDRPVVLLSSPNSSCLLAAIGGFQTIGTLYWENVEGLKSAARALNAQSDEEALELFQEHGITHISLMTWENFIEPYFHILHANWQSSEMKTVRFDGSGKEETGAATDTVAKSPEASFGIRALFRGTIPGFVRPIVFPGNDLTQGLNQRVLLLRVAPEQTPEEARLHLARFTWKVDNNTGRAESDLRELARGSPVAFAANAELGELYLALQRYHPALEAFRKVLSAPDPALRDSANTMALEGLAAAGRFMGAKEIAVGAASQPDAAANTLINSAWFLCTAANLEVRDPALAAEWISRVAAMEDADPVALAFLRAAQLGAMKKYEEAVAAAHEAGKVADTNLRRVEVARQMIEKFSNNQPWKASAR